MGKSKFNRGDEVYIAFPGGGRFAVIKEVDERFRIVRVQSGENEFSTSLDILCSADEVDRDSPYLDIFEKLLTERSEIFKPGTAIMHIHCGYGVVSEVLSDGTACVDFKHYGRRRLETRSFNSWLATEENKNWQPRELRPEPEPMCEPEDVTLASLEDAVAHWEKSVSYIESGLDDDPDEYTHDLFARDGLHGVLNGFATQGLAVPTGLKTRIDAADKRFIELTYEIETHVWGSSDIYDKNIFWYYYRWLIK